MLRDSPGAQPDETRAYDLLGRQSCAQTWLTAPAPSPIVCSGGSPLQTVSATFDALSRQLSESSAAGTVSYQYDAGGRRTRMDWPGGFFVTYAYNTAGELLGVLQSGSVGLVSYAYDNLGRRTGVGRSNGVASGLSYDAVSRLAALTHDAAATAHDQQFNYAYNTASQMLTRTRSNAAYDWITTAVYTRSYAANGLNQYTSVGGGAVTHDARGNLTGDGLRTYSYDYDNRLTGVSGGVVLDWDPVNRLGQVTSGAATTRFLYDGSDLIAEMDGSGNVLRRYVHGAAPDEPVVWYEGAGVSDRRWLLSDERGSIIGVSAAESGAMATVNRYDEYGVPGAANAGRFQYTGQVWLPEVGLYHYKARIYHPGLGRFLQTDPIRYGDGMNIYAYVGNDPMNGWDSTGKWIEDVAIGIPSVGLGTYSAYQNGRAGRWGAMSVDIGGVVADIIAIAVPFVPGAAGVGIQAARHGDDIAGAVQRTADLAADARGLVYRRTNMNTGRCYIGRCNSDELYRRRQSDHGRQNPDADYDFEILERAEPGAPLRQAEQRQIDAHGGPTNKSNPNGGTENMRNEIRPNRSNNETEVCQMVTGSRICR